MAVLYVVEQGAVVSKRGDTVMICKDQETLRSVPAFALEQLVLFGRVQLTAPARDYLLEKEIDTVFMTRAGRFRGRLTSYTGGNIELRQAQFRRCEQPEFLLDLGRRFVAGKLSNCRAVLRRHQRRLQDSHVERGLLRLRKSIALLEQGRTLDEIRGYEGDGSASYFSCLDRLLRQPGFEFHRRTRRPPLDPFNALLSFGYTMLLGTVMTAVYMVGLEPYLGTLHVPTKGRPSMGLDLMEEFRPILVDAVAVRAINRRQFLPEEFEYHPAVGPTVPFSDGESPPPSEYPVLLGRLGIKKWIALYEEQLRVKIDYPRYGCRLAFGQIVIEQARLLARHFLGEEPYQAFVVR